MKLSNIFNTKKTIVKATIEKIEKTQLEKIIGGTETTPTDVEEQERNAKGRLKCSDITLE